MKEKSGEILPTPVTEPVTQRQGWNVKRTIAGGILALVLYLRFYSVDTLDYRTARTLAGYRSFLVPAGCRSKKSPISQQEIEQVLIDTPTSESARNASHSLSTSAHIAGTEGDRLSALLVKEQWEQLLHLPVTSPSHNLFESGTTASRRALTGRGGCARKGRSWLDRIKWKLGWTHSKRHSQSPRVYIDTYHPLLNYPLSHSLTLTPPGADKPSFVAKVSLHSLFSQHNADLVMTSSSRMTFRRTSNRSKVESTSPSFTVFPKTVPPPLNLFTLEMVENKILSTSLVRESISRARLRSFSILEVSEVRPSSFRRDSATDDSLYAGMKVQAATEAGCVGQSAHLSFPTFVLNHFSALSLYHLHRPDRRRRDHGSQRSSPVSARTRSSAFFGPTGIRPIPFFLVRHSFCPLSPC